MSTLTRPTTAARYRSVRADSEGIAEGLSPEDCTPQSMPDASPIKWHLAHTSWFFETFVLESELPDFRPFDPGFRVLFNSYYNTVGDQYSRPDRGLVTRPSLAQVRAYRAHVDERIADLLERGVRPEVESVVEVGLHHEQQHQELMLTDLKHLLSANPLAPAYRQRPDEVPGVTSELRWHRFDGGLCRVGLSGEGFAFDNERPEHSVWVEPFELGHRLVTQGEFQEFIAAGGYSTPELWLADGWDLVQREGWRAPLYWQRRDDAWWAFTLAGLRQVATDEPVCHLSYYEADAFARWAGARLPREHEWEVAVSGRPIDGNLGTSGRLHPAAAPADRDGLTQMYGDVWEWTESPYTPYPGFSPLSGSLGEYNGKFMCNQLVLRGGSCATPAGHVRPTYRNFFYPHQRWQFVGLRLARDAR